MSSKSSERCNINDFSEEKSKLLGEVKDFVSGLLSRGDVSLEEAENLISEEVRSWEQRLLQMYVSQDASEKESEAVECPEDEQSC